MNVKIEKKKKNNGFVLYRFSIFNSMDYNNK